MSEMKIIAHIHTDFPTKFGIPRQPGDIPGLIGRVVFTPDYRNADSLRGITEYSHLWLLWEFSESMREEWSPTVRPPRLGGNTRVGVFATRSPFRPNPIGLSCVRLLGIEADAKDGTVLLVSGTDLMDGTPIYDIKPYLPLYDSKPEATGSFSTETVNHVLEVYCDEELLAVMPAEKRSALLAVLSQDPRPSYQEDAARVYGFAFAGFEIKFCVDGKVLTVKSITLTQAL